MLNESWVPMPSADRPSLVNPRNSPVTKVGAHLVSGGDAAGQALPRVAVRERRAVSLDRDHLAPRIDAAGVGRGRGLGVCDVGQNAVAVPGEGLGTEHSVVASGKAAG